MHSSGGLRPQYQNVLGSGYDLMIDVITVKTAAVRVVYSSMCRKRNSKKAADSFITIIL